MSAIYRERVFYKFDFFVLLTQILSGFICSVYQESIPILHHINATMPYGITEHSSAFISTFIIKDVNASLLLIVLLIVYGKVSKV